jgi:hypothetical protein
VGTMGHRAKSIVAVCCIFLVFLPLAPSPAGLTCREGRWMAFPWICRISAKEHDGGGSQAVNDCDIDMSHIMTTTALSVAAPSFLFVCFFLPNCPSAELVMTNQTRHTTQLHHLDACGRVGRGLAPFCYQVLVNLRSQEGATYHADNDASSDLLHA